MQAGGTKVVFSHSRLSIATGGITAGGTIALFVPRAPTVTITGPTTVDITGDAPVPLRFRIVTYDLRGTHDSPLRIGWSGDGAAASPTSAATEIAFTPPARRDHGRPGQLTTQVVSVQVTDADDLSASARFAVRLRDLRGSLPPICAERPDLPQCRPSSPRPRR
jgi:hypothetical protein